MVKFFFNNLNLKNPLYEWHWILFSCCQVAKNHPKKNSGLYSNGISPCNGHRISSKVGNRGTLVNYITRLDRSVSKHLSS